jgi:hypothetical protein
MTQRTSVPSRPPSALELSPVALSPVESSDVRDPNRICPEIGESQLSQDHSYPVRAFGRATLRYYSFLQALLEGLLEYEAKKGERHATQPLPVA